MSTRRANVSSGRRFEVFKRDSFACQYCGRKAPEVILHVDHIVPVSKGGTADLLNLATACDTCNLGKGARRLADGSVVEAQRLQAEALQAKYEQLAMLAAWHHGLARLDQTGAEEAQRFWAELTGHEFTIHDVRGLRRLIRQFGLGEVLEAMRIAVDQYGEQQDAKLTEDSLELCWQKVGGICFVRMQEAQDPGGGKVFLTRGILRKRFDLTTYRLVEALELLRRGRTIGLASEEQQARAKKARSYNSWYAEEMDAIERAEAAGAEPPVPSAQLPVAPTDYAELDEELDGDLDEEGERADEREEEARFEWEEAQEDEQHEEQERECRARGAREFWARGGRDIVRPEPRPADAANDLWRAPWCCRACGQWIPAMSAVIEILDDREGHPVGGYPKGAGDTGGSTRSDIAIYALHSECIPEGVEGYEITGPLNLETWVGWVLHLFSKSWMSRTDLQRLLGFWWDGRRLTPPE